MKTNTKKESIASRAFAVGCLCIFPAIVLAVILQNY